MTTWKGVPPTTWLIVGFALLVLLAGLIAMGVMAKEVDAKAITSLVVAVLGVVGTHIGHVSGHSLAIHQAELQREKPPGTVP